ncbi:MAG: 2-oxo acid dehydrogenase subunit E2 [Ktedonobacteraceae bacterium]|nr:2-oxo acid dehydrogenase subunit E2 [Ktedonobacteraceae bacterium]
MPTSVKMPRLGESVAEGTIGSWLKKEGDYVEKDESLAEIVTDKINAELPSPVAGRVSKILVQADETVPVGTDIALIEESADITAAPAAALQEPQAPPSATPVPSTASEQARPAEPVALKAERREAREDREDRENGSRAAREQGGEEERQRISPLARRLAREHGINLNDIAGTGIGGRVRKEDILAYLAQRPVAQAAALSAPSAPSVAPAPSAAPQDVPFTQEVPVSSSQPAIAAVAGPDEQLIEPDRMRLAIAEHMVRSKHTAPHATAVIEVDMTAIARWLEKNKEEFKRREGYSISYVPFVMKAACAGLRAVPEMNASWTSDNKIVLKKRINLGVAVATDAGLVVPTVYDADQYTLAGLARQVNALAQRARAGRLTVQDMQGSTFVVNNTGVFGILLSTPIINQPHAGILAMNAVVKRPVVTEDDAIAIRSMMYLCLSFDHRILDGVGAGAFLRVVREKLESYGQDVDVY